MKSLMVVGCVVLVACSSAVARESTRSANPCATKGATYLQHLVERPGGTCGVIRDSTTTINADGTTQGPGVTCDEITQDACTAHDTNCSATGGTTGSTVCASSFTITFADDGVAAHGEETISCHDDTRTCTSTYDVLMWRQ